MLKLGACVIVVALAISGCTHVPTIVAPDTNATNGVDGSPCNGTINGDVPRLVESANASLVAQTQRPTSKGYLCSAKTFSVIQPERVYPLIDSTQPY